MSIEQNKRIIQRLVDEFWNQGNPTAADELLADDLRNLDPNHITVTGREELKQWLACIRSAFPDFRLMVNDVIADRNRVVKTWIARATHQREFLGCPTTGRSIVVSGVCIYALLKGRVVEISWNYDMLGFLRQLGMQRLPDPPAG